MISVVIVNYNGADHLGRCLESLLVSEPAPDEILVVDNASADGSVELVATRFPGVRLLELEENVGFASAANRGAEQTTGESLLLLNADSWVAPGCVERLVSCLQREPKAGLAAPQLYYPDGRLQFVWFPRTSVVAEAVQKLRNRFEGSAWNHRPRLQAVLRGVGPIVFCAACLLVRRQAFDAVGGFDSRIFLYFEDVDFCVRLLAAGWRLELAPEARAFHFSGGSGRQRSEELYRCSQLYYYRKHRPAWEGRILRSMLLRKYRRLSRRWPANEAIVRFLEEADLSD